jgi:type IV pilus assembly protein PilN
MKTINLLPWREIERRERQQQFLATTAAVFIGSLLLVGAVHLLTSKMLDWQENRILFLREQINNIENQILEVKGLRSKKDRMLKRMQVVEELQANRAFITHLFDQLVRAVPDNVVLTEMEQLDKELKITGIANSHGAVSTFMRQLNESFLFHNARLEVIEVGKGGVFAGGNRFVLYVNYDMQAVPKQ